MMITTEHLMGIEILAVCILLVFWLAAAAEDWEQRKRKERERREP